MAISSHVLRSRGERTALSTKRIFAALLLAALAAAFAAPAMKVDNTNLAPIPPALFWTSGNAGGQSYGWSISDGTRGDLYPVAWQGESTIEMQPNPTYEKMAFNTWGGISELDGYQPISVGDVVFYSAWIWTTAGANGDAMGAKFGCDVYGSGGGYTGRIQEVDDVGGVGVPDYNGVSYNYITNGWVPWGSGEWVHKSMMVTIQPIYISDGFNGAVGSGTGGAPLGTVMTPTEICPWICTVSSLGSSSGFGDAYVYGTILEVNPSGTSTPAPTIAPTSTPGSGSGVGGG